MAVQLVLQSRLRPLSQCKNVDDIPKDSEKGGWLKVDGASRY